MANIVIWILVIVIFIIIGYFLGKYIAEQKKWGTKKAELEKEYEIRISNTEKQLIENQKEFEKIKGEFQTSHEKTLKEIQVNHENRIANLELEYKGLIKEAMKVSVMRSRSGLMGKLWEQMVPYLPKFLYHPADMRFMGSPIDYIIFDGMNEKNIKKVIFLEIKTGKSGLNPQEKQLKKVIESGKVEWEEFRSDEITSTSKDIKINEDIDKKIEERFNEIKTKAQESSKITNEYTDENNKEATNNEEDKWEDLSDDDIEKYKEKVMFHRDFPKGDVSSNQILRFIKKNFPEICDELDDDGLNIIIEAIEDDIYE